MPNRILRDWTNSDKVDSLTFQAEVFLTRLIMKADDFGCFWADSKRLKANLFPLKSDSIRESDISRWLAECQKAGLIVSYESDRKKFLQIVDFGQRKRAMIRKFPCPSDDGQLTDIRRPEVENRKEEEKEVEDEGKKFLGIVIYDAEKEILKNQIEFERICAAAGKNLSDAGESLRKYHLYLEEKEQYPKGRKAVFAGFEKWLLNEKTFNNGSHKQTSNDKNAGLTKLFNNIEAAVAAGARSD